MNDDKKQLQKLEQARVVAAKKLWMRQQAINHGKKIEQQRSTGIVLGDSVLRINGEIVSNGGGFYINGTGADLREKTETEKE